MHIQKLEFFVSPEKLFSYLNQGKRQDKLVMLQDGRVNSVDQMNRGRYTYIGFGEKVLMDTISYPNRNVLEDVMMHLSAELEGQKKVLNEYLSSCAFREELEGIPFLYGLMGFFSYDLGLGFEEIVSTCLDDRGYPSYYFMVPEEVVIFDHDNKYIWVVHANECADVEFFESLRTIHFKEPIVIVDHDGEKVVSNLTEEEYLEKIGNVKEYLKRGETYQVNFSQRFAFQSLQSPWEMYKKMTEINPSGHQVFFSGRMGDVVSGKKFWIVSNSPERLLRVRCQGEERMIETRPIKGTIGFKGDETQTELDAISQELLYSDKDRAELEMIVDMSRNDLGRICEFGTVQVDEHRVLEKYSHLFHTVSNVSGQLKKNVRLYDIFRAMFPGASITGCPKKRTMEIIDELEEYSRGVYCGSAGYLDCRGNMDFNIMIRTLFGQENRSGGYRYVIHSGGGVVIDSQADLEFQETFDKVNAFLEAIQ